MQNTGYDRQMADRVWKRVQGNTPRQPERMPLSELIALEWADSRCCLRMSQTCTGSKRLQLQRIGREKQQNVRMLKGIGRLQTGRVPQVPQPPVPPEDLRECCRRAAQCAEQYETMADDPECGSCFRHLADRARHHSHQLLALLGESF